MNIDYSPIKDEAFKIFRTSLFAEVMREIIDKYELPTIKKWVACFIPAPDGKDAVSLYCRDLKTATSANGTPAIGEYVFSKRVFEIYTFSVYAQPSETALAQLREFLFKVKTVANQQNNI